MTGSAGTGAVGEVSRAPVVSSPPVSDVDVDVDDVDVAAAGGGATSFEVQAEVMNKRVKRSVRVRMVLPT